MSALPAIPPSPPLVGSFPTPPPVPVPDVPLPEKPTLAPATKAALEGLLKARRLQAEAPARRTIGPERRRREASDLQANSRSACSWHFKQRSAQGTAASRLGSMGSLHSRQVPKFPSGMRARASSTSWSC